MANPIARSIPCACISAVTAYARLRPVETRVVDTAVMSEDCPWARKRMEFALKK